MKLDREGVLFKDGTGLYWPFPRLRYRLRHGHWCEHPNWGPWELIDMGRTKMRRCPDCTQAQFL